MLGDLNTNSCPIKAVPDASTCADAAQEVGGSYIKEGWWYVSPKGCYMYSTLKVYWNTHKTGKARVDAQPICYKCEFGIFSE